jgi:lipoate-protein ligase A
MNMAIDEVLLESAIRAGTATLRIYRWNEPTVSLGYFQPHDDPIIGQRFEGLPVVRRLSGGGAILHDHETTYSVVYPPGHDFGDNPSRLYDAVHASVVQLLNSMGVPARLRGAPLADHPFLCFGRGDARDVVVGASKVMGSAQRRRSGGVLQHGALLLRRSPWAEEFAGLSDLAAVSQDMIEKMPELLGAAISDSLPEPTIPMVLNPDEEQRANALASTQYATPEQIARRSFRGS